MSIITSDVRQVITGLITEWARDLEVEGRAESTIGIYVEIVTRAHTELSAGLLSNLDELVAWIWQPGRKPATKALYRAALRSFYGWANHPRRPRIDYDPSRWLPSVKVPTGRGRPAEHEQLADILARAIQPMRTWMLLAAAMGLRCVEIARLDREDITQERTWVQGKGHTEKDATVVTHPAVWEAVRDLPPGPIARNIVGERATRKQVYMRANMHIRTLGYLGVTMHRLRSWHGTYVYRASGRDILIAKAALRHANVNTTQVYIQDDDPGLTRAVLELPLPI